LLLNYLWFRWSVPLSIVDVILVRVISGTRSIIHELLLKFKKKTKDKKSRIEEFRKIKLLYDSLILWMNSLFHNSSSTLRNVLFCH